MSAVDFAEVVLNKRAQSQKARGGMGRLLSRLLARLPGRRFVCGSAVVGLAPFAKFLAISLLQRAVKVNWKLVQLFRSREDLARRKRGRREESE